MAKSSNGVTHIRQLTPDPHNARRRTERNLGMIRDALGEVGAARSIVIDEGNRILAGNGTIEAAADAGITKVQVVEADGETIIAVRRSGLTEAQKVKLSLYDNRAAELAEWDAAQLQVLAGITPLESFWSPKELLKVWRDLPRETGLTEPDALPPEPETVRVVPGQGFTLGAHRVLCGDSASPADRDRLLNGAVLECVVTSPPYNQRLSTFANATGMHAESRWTDRFESAYPDALPEDEYQQAQVDLLTAWWAAMRPGGSLFYNHKHRFRNRRPIIPLDWIRRTPWELRQEIIWDQRWGPAANANMFIPREERIYWCERADGEPKWRGVGANFSNVWNFSGAQKDQADNTGHVCPFPVELVTRCIEAVTDLGDAVADPFGGAGTVVLGCEQTGRRAYVMEREPRYVQIILDRWERFTGQTAEAWA